MIWHEENLNLNNHSFGRKISKIAKTAEYIYICFDRFGVKKNSTFLDGLESL